MSKSNTEATETSALDRFFDNFDAEIEKRNIRKSWHVSLFQATNEEELLPYSVDYSTQYVTQYLPRPKILKEKTWAPGEYYETEDYDAPQEIDADSTNKLIAKIIKHARDLGYSVEKKYDDDEFKVIVTLLDNESNPEWFPYGVTVTYIANRKSVCEKITRTVHVPQQVVEAHDEEEVSWDCKKVSFLAMDTED